MRALVVATLVVALVPGFAAARIVEPEPAEASDEPAEASPAAAPPAPADDGEDPRARAAAAFLEGSKAFELGQFSLAVEKFELAWELSREPLLLFNLGQAQYRWFQVDGDPDHLRRARVFYENYDKRMRGSEGYKEDEIEAILRSLELELEKAEESREGRVERELVAKAEAERRRALIEREKRIVRGFNASGTTLIVLGALTLVVGLGGILGRTANKVVLDNSSGGDRGPNLASAEEDARRRKGFLVGGQLAFSGFIIGGVLLPAGLALRIIGEVRERRALGRAPQANARAKLELDGSGLTVRW